MTASQMFLMDCLLHFKREEVILNLIVVLFAIKVCIDLANFIWRRK